MIGGAASVAGAAISSSSARKQAKEQNQLAIEQSEQQYRNDMEAMHLQRQWDLEDRQFAIDNPTKIVNEVDVQKMVRDAEAAGFNPLTLLRNGGSAGYSSSSQPSAPLSRQAPVRQAPLLQAAPRSSAMGAAIGGFLDNFDPFQDSKRELEYKLVEAQIANLNANTASYATRPSSFNVPAYSAGTVERRASGAAARLGKPTPPTVGDVTVTNPWERAEVDPRVRDAAAFEERYGDSEFAQMLYGGYVGVRDFWANQKTRINRDLARGAALSRQRKRENAARASRIRREAASNARNLGFDGY